MAKNTETRTPAPATSPRTAHVQASIAPLLVVALLLFQGGYYPGATCVIALIALAVFAFAVALRKAQATFRWFSAVLLVMGLAYLISALAHGATLSMLQEAATWFALAGMSLWCAFPTAKEHDKALERFSMAGVALAAAGILMYAGLIPLEGAVNASRLMFTFQYANAAGLFFAVIAVLCLCSSRREHRIAALVPIVALFLTQSVGALAVFFAALVVIAIRWGRSIGRAPLVLLSAVAASAAVIAGACLLMRERLVQAAGTFVERIVQMLDAVSLLSGNVVLGVGPDQWQFAYPAVQSAQYRAADVHCSYLQVALDAGLPALLLLAALTIGGVVLLVRRRAFAPSLAAGMVCVHALFDFDFQFSAIAFLFVLLIARPEGESHRVRPREQLRKALCLSVLVCSLAAACGGVYLDLQVGRVQGDLVRGDARQALEEARSKPYLVEDAAVETLLCEGLLQAGDNQAVLELADQLSSASGSIGLCRALAQQRLGMDEEACQTLSETLAANPYDVELLQSVRDLITESGLGEAYLDVFNAAAAASNGRAREGHAAWLPNQKQVDLIGADSGKL